MVTKLWDDGQTGRPPWLLLLPLLLALPVTAVVVLNGFDGLYGQDAYAYYRYATGPLRESLLELRPPPPFFWPPGYPLLVTLLSLPLGVSSAAGQVVSLAAGAMIPLLTALLAWEVWSTERPVGASDRYWVPLLAGALVACMGQLWQSSAVVMSDTTGLAATTLGVWALVRYGRGASGLWLILAAAAVAFSVLTRWANGLVALACTGYALYALAQRPRRAAIRHAVVAGLAVGAVASPLLLSLAQGWQAPGAGEVAFAGDLEVVRWNPLNAVRNEFSTSDGRLRYRFPNGLYYALAPAHRYYFTPLLALLLPLGFWTAARRRASAQMLLLSGWAAIVYIFLAGIAWQNLRFTLAYLPPLAILAAVGSVPLAERLSGRWRWTMPTVLGIGLLWMVFGGWALTGSFIERKEAHLQLVRWVEAQVESDARLFTFGLTTTVNHYSGLQAHDLFLLEPDEMTRFLADSRPVYLLLDVENVERQWEGHAPAQNYLWLQRETGLEEMGGQRGFTLFRLVSEET